jgi:hypothetical protein
LNLDGGQPVAAIFLVGETIHTGGGLGEDLPVKSAINAGSDSHELLPVVASTRQDPGQVEIVAGLSPAEYRRCLGGNGVALGQHGADGLPHRRVIPGVGSQVN